MNSTSALTNSNNVTLRNGSRINNVGGNLTENHIYYDPPAEGRLCKNLLVASRYSSATSFTLVASIRPS